jgi:hypothetical protein
MATRPTRAQAAADEATSAPDPATDPKGDEAKPPPGVVPTSELRAHTPDGPVDNATEAPVGTALAGPSLEDGVVAEHWHEPSNGPENTPAGAHRHTPDGPVHVHVVPPAATVADIRPAPHVEGADDSDEAKDSSADVVFDTDFRAVVDGQIIEYRKGQKVGGRVGKYLADTGAPVTAGK